MTAPGEEVTLRWAWNTFIRRYNCIFPPRAYSVATRMLSVGAPFSRACRTRCPTMIAATAGFGRRCQTAEGAPEIYADRPHSF